MCSSGAACELPALPGIPEEVGDDVARVLIDVRRYADSMIEYTDCLKAELAAAGGDAAPLFQRSALILRNSVCEQDRIFPGREDFSRRVIGCALGRFFALSEEQALQILARRSEQTPEQAK